MIGGDKRCVYSRVRGYRPFGWLWPSQQSSDRMIGEPCPEPDTPRPSADVQMSYSLIFIETRALPGHALSFPLKLTFSICIPVSLVPLFPSTIVLHESGRRRQHCHDARGRGSIERHLTDVHSLIHAFHLVCLCDGRLYRNLLRHRMKRTVLLLAARKAPFVKSAADSFISKSSEMMPQITVSSCSHPSRTFSKSNCRKCQRNMWHVSSMIETMRA